MGGFGNQLFQLARGLTANHEINRDVRFVLNAIESRFLRGTSRRECQIGPYLFPNELVKLGLAERTVMLGLFKSQRLGFSIESPSRADSRCGINERSRGILGYFQDVTYVDRSWIELEKRFASALGFELVPTDEHDEIAVHVRLGDYESNRKARAHHGLTGPSYFATAISYFEDLGVGRSVRVYSDDSAAAVSLIQRIYSGRLPVEPAISRDVYAELRSMASSRAIIISNSSFSWWAAWIGYQTVGARVVYPNPWFADGTANPNLFPASWLGLSRSIV